MGHKFHRGFTAAEKTELWDRWKRGESLKAIGRAFGKQSSSIYFLVAPHGGIRPAQRRRARLARPEHHMHSDIEGSSPLNSILLGAPEGERGEPSSDGIRPANVPKVQLAEGNPIAPSEPAEGRKPDAVSYLPADAQATPLAPADSQASPRSPLLKAIVEPDIYTAPADRERAITLRWVLRDIKANRLNLSPIDQCDLLDLIEMRLVEIRNDVPVLTDAGANAIL
jgi:hypothetical protein